MSPTSSPCLHPLPPPRLHCHGPVPAASSSPLYNIHMGVPRSRCSTPWSHHALGFHIAGAARRGVPMCSALPPTRHHAFCPPHTSFVSLPGVGGTGRQPLNIIIKLDFICPKHLVNYTKWFNNSCDTYHSLLKGQPSSLVMATPALVAASITAL